MGTPEPKTQSIGAGGAKACVSLGHSTSKVKRIKRLFLVRLNDSTQHYSAGTRQAEQVTCI